MLINYLKRNNRLSDENFAELKRWIIPIGLISMSGSIIMKKFLPETGILSFVEGLLLGISLVANISGIILLRNGRELKEK